MWRRVYVAFPYAGQARRNVAELEAAGVARNQIHTIAKPGVDIAGLPVANRAQRSDQVWLWERVFWYGKLGLFVVALAAVGLAMCADAFGWAAVAATVTAGTVVVGKRFAVELPHGHLGDLRVPLARGEVVLLVDVPHHRVRAIDALIGHQPEASIGGVGWTIVAAGI
jgi:hypothetical protein